MENGILNVKVFLPAKIWYYKKVLDQSNAEQLIPVRVYLQPVRDSHALLFAVGCQLVKELDLRENGILIVEGSILVMANFWTKLKRKKIGIGIRPGENLFLNLKIIFGDNV